MIGLANEPPNLEMNPLWVEVNPLPKESAPPGWGFYQNMRPNTNKRGDTRRYLLFYFALRAGGESNDSMRMSGGHALAAGFDGGNRLCHHENGLFFRGIRNCNRFVFAI